MLWEIPRVRQIPGEPRRRWFNSRAFDLIVWYDEVNSPVGFQLCYGKEKSERALPWNPPAKYNHMAVDDGEGRTFHHKATPILVPDGHFDASAVCEAFVRESTQLPRDIVDLVVGKLRQHPQHAPSGA
jgi:hypothetical protein